MISIVIVQYNHPDLTKRAVETLRMHHRGELEIIVVDNGSREAGVRAATEQFTGCTVIFNPANAGFGAANNRGARASHGELVLFLNNDTLVRTEILPQIESYFAGSPSCGAAGLQLLNADGTVQYSTGKFPTVWSEWRMSRRHNLYKREDTVRRDWVSGAALVVRRTVFEEVRGFDDRYFMYFEDVDLCARIRGAGHEIHYIPAIGVEHLRGGSQPDGIPPSVQMEYRRSQLLYYSRHASMINNLLLRAYLFARFFPHRLLGNRDQRTVAQAVLSTLFRPRDERRY
ncbi:MAG TPA: glycosyltransferase family 2 protein [Bacteroidota bacterium]